MRILSHLSHVITFKHARPTVIRVSCRCGAWVISGGDDPANAERIAGTWTREHRAASR